MVLCRLYVDEVGNGDLKGAAADPNVRYLSLTGIITKVAAHERHIQPEIDRLKRDLFGHADSSPVILHRREIVRKEGPFNALRDDVTRAEFDARCLDLIARLPYIAMTVTIDKKEHLERYQVWQYDPYHYCMRLLTERYIYWLNRHRLQGDVVVEARFKKVDKLLKSSFLQTYDNGTQHLPPRIIQRCLSAREIKFVTKADNCAGAQLVDLLAHPSFRSMRLESERRCAPDDFGSKVVDILKARRYARHPHTRVIDGYGRKWLP